jgi:threonyl-tRNA synthetase
MPVEITYPDGSKRIFDHPPTGLEIADQVSKTLSRSAVAVKVNGQLWDLTRPIDAHASVEIISRDSQEALELLRHDAAHVMAEAVKELYPETQVTIGPAIEDGFYYDFSRDEPFTLDDLNDIDQRMREIVDRDEVITREVWDRDQAIRYFRELGEEYKAQIIAEIDPAQEITVYRQGTFLDLCRGPHLPSTGRLGNAFRLTKVAGAYWRGDSRNPMLQRIYGTAWASDKQLKDYLRRLEEAERRDHRKLAKQMDLVHFQEEAPGAVFWHPKGWTLFLTLTDYMRARQQSAGYVEVNTPDLMQRSLWEASGHWETFGENMFTTNTDVDRTLAIKPMNCPGCVQIFNNSLRSYRELPLRMAEFGKVHRFEPSGALHGLMRVRSFTQDDAHIFCATEQITEESTRVCDLVLDIYRDFGFDDIRIKYADRPDKRVGSDDVWDAAENALLTAAEATGLVYTLNPGEGAFYGPKLEFVLRDAIGRDWQCGTLQVDLNLPERLGAKYVGEDGQKHTPVMLHRALFGSLERFIGILLEHYAGALPFWLTPLQVVVATVVSDADAYAMEFAQALREARIRTEVDLRNEKISYKLREHSVQKIPVIAVVGRREAEQRTVALRRFGVKQQDTVSWDEAIKRFVAMNNPPSQARRLNADGVVAQSA